MNQNNVMSVSTVLCFTLTPSLHLYLHAAFLSFMKWKKEWAGCRSGGGGGGATVTGCRALEASGQIPSTVRKTLTIAVRV